MTTFPKRMQYLQLHLVSGLLLQREEHQLSWPKLLQLAAIRLLTKSALMSCWERDAEPNHYPICRVKLLCGWMWHLAYYPTILIMKREANSFLIHNSHKEDQVQKFIEASSMTKIFLPRGTRRVTDTHIFMYIYPHNQLIQSSLNSPQWLPSHI